MKTEKNNLIELTNIEMQSLSAGFGVPWAKIGKKVLENIAVEEATEAWNCFWDELL
ncbi:hypothetical protein [Gracilimonas sp.]|uniref:hypothetical protein n=1 Tax=Gracilimonas sp. TaxID=1974203 RepID=UPI0032ED3AC2